MWGLRVHEGVLDTPYARIGVEYRWYSAGGYRGAGTQRYAQTSGIYESVAADDVMATAIPCEEVRVEETICSSLLCRGRTGRDWLDLETSSSNNATGLHKSAKKTKSGLPD